MTDEKGSLEQRTQNANAQKLPEKLSAYCEICKEERIFNYFSTQHNPFGKDILMYNCRGDVAINSENI